MSTRKASRKLNAAKRRELEVAAAIAREAVMQFHVTSAIRFIELADERVSAVRMLEIYLRLHRIVDAPAELLAYRVLAALGQRSSRNGVAPNYFVEGEVEDDFENTRSLFRVVRNRLRGRVHHDLRRMVEIATGSTQIALIELHVRHAMKFVQELAATHSIAEAAMLYTEMAGVPVSYKDTLYLFLLDRLATEELPRPAAKGAAAPATAPRAPMVAPERAERPERPEPRPDPRPVFPGGGLRTAV